MPQPQPRQQSRLNDIQMLQRQIMFKKLQELQRQQQFQEFGDARQHNYTNQQYRINKNISGDQFPPLIDRTTVIDASQRYMAGNINLMHQSAPPVVEGFSNGMAFPPPQTRALYSMGMVSPQVDASLYGTPVPSLGNNLGHYSQLLDASFSSINMFEKGDNKQQDKPITQSSTYNNSVKSNFYDGSSNQIDMPEGQLVLSKEFQGKKLLGQVPNETSNCNFQEVNMLERGTSANGIGGLHEQAAWTGQFPGKATNMGSLQDFSSLDPLEQKILFDTDDNDWDTSFGNCSNTTLGVFSNTSEGADHTSAFPSIQSGSWSALMQSAVAETSISDTGIQEEWSGLTNQNSELSTRNQPFNFVVSGKHPPDWVEENLQTASALSSKPEVDYKNPTTSSSFPGFQQHPGIQFPLKPKDGINREASEESNQQNSPKNSNLWSDCSSLPKQTIDGSQPGQRLSPLRSAWPDPNYEQSESNAHQESISMYTSGIQPGNSGGSAHGVCNSPWKIIDKHAPGSVSTSLSRLEQVRSGNINNNHPISKSNQHLYGKDTDVSVENGGMDNVGNNQYRQSNSPQISNNAYSGASRTYEEQKCIEGENSNDSNLSNASQHTIAGHDLKENMWQHKSNSRHVPDSNQRPSSQVLYQQIPRESRGYELGHEQFNFNGNVPSNDPSLEKRHLPSIQRNLMENVSPRNHDNTSAFFGTTSVLHAPNMTSQTRLSPTSQWNLQKNCYASSHSSPNLVHSGETVSLGLSLVRNQLQNEDQLIARKVLPGLDSSQDTSTNSYSQQLPVTEANPTSHPFVMSGISEEAGFPMIWKNAPAQRDNDFETASVAPLVLHKESNYQENDSGSLMTSSHQQGFDWTQRDNNQSRNVSDLEVFGRSLQPSHISSQKYSFLQELDLANKSEDESGLTIPQSTAYMGQQSYGDSSGIQNAVNNEVKSMSRTNLHPAGEEESQNFSFERGNQSANFFSQPLLRDANHETVALGQCSSPRVSDATMQSQISLQMAPSWFKHYGILKNGQMLPMFDPRAAPQFSPGKILENVHMNSSGIHGSSSGAGQESIIWPTAANNMVAVKSSTPSCLLPPDVLLQNLEILRPRKRKVAAFEPLPWHKEASQGSQRFHNVSLSDLEWAQATNRLNEKVEDEASTFEDSSVPRPKKRLTFTTQLMQHVFRPAPAVIHHRDATSDYENLAYFAARLALGDACSLNSTHSLCGISDMSSEKFNTPMRAGGQESIVVEDFLARSTKLEAKFLILEKSASISDARVESQELEKISMINHFAKFHSRGPAGAADASSVKRVFLQKYVKAAPMPRTVPEGAQCLSL